MPIIRRFYLYLVAFVSLEVVVWGAVGLARSLLGGQFVSGAAGQLALPLAFTLVGLPVFALHWWLIGRLAAADPDDGSSRLRAVFLYGGLAATLVPIVQNLLALLDRGLLEVLGAPGALAIFGGGQSLADNLAGMALNALAAAFLYRVAAQGWRLAPAGDDWHETRRLYRYLWMLYGLALFAAGVNQLLQYLLGLAGSLSPGEAAPLAHGLALLLVGAPLWAGVWRWIGRQLAAPGEAESLLRLAALYLLALAGVGGLLASGGLALNALLGRLLAGSFSLARLVDDLTSPLAAAVPLGAIWAYFGGLLNREVGALASAPRRAGLRRVYLYILAAIGLAAALGGLSQLLSFFAEAAAGLGPEEALGQQAALRSLLSQALALLAVGLPPWVLAWRQVQREAALDGEPGDHARRSPLRRGYLYLAIFTGVMGVMFSSGTLLFNLLQAALGEVPEGLGLQALLLLRLVIVFALLLGYHAWALRRDGRLAGKALARRHAQFPVLVLGSDAELEAGGFAALAAAALQREAPGMPVALHPAALGAPDEALSAARAVILSAELAARPNEALRLWLAQFDGERLVAALPAAGWRWLGAGAAPAALARQAARAARLLAEGQEPPASPAASPWMAAVYLAAGLFVLQVGLAVVILLLSALLGG